MSKTKKIVLAAVAVVLVAAIAVSVALFGDRLSPEETVPTTEATTEVTTEPTTEATTEATTEPTEPPVLYRHPLTGDPLDEPINDRIFAVSISNVQGALPHIGLNDCDIFFEMFIAPGYVRGLALYTDIENVSQIGSVRSTRINFADIAKGYDAFIAHAGGSELVLNYVYNSGVDHKNIDTPSVSAYSFRDFERHKNWSWEHCLFVDGPGLKEWAGQQGYRVSHEAAKTYGLNFVDGGAMEAGDTANTVNIGMRFYSSKKDTVMVYDPEIGEYIYNQYGMEMHDGHTNEIESFKNVFILKVKAYSYDIYTVAELLGSGEGYYACDGRIIPIKWVRENATDPFTFTMPDGSPLYQNVGRSYINLAPLESEITWE